MSLITLESFPLTSAYHKAPLVASDTNDLLVFIPGNPGLVEYYITYLDLIQQQHPTFEIYCLSQAGYQTTDDYIKEGAKAYPIYNLDFQVQHKVKIIQDIVSKKKGPVNLHIFAHSVGAFITQRMIKPLLENPQITIKFVGLICPTVINIKESDSGQKLVKLHSYLPVVWMATMLSWILTAILPDLAITFIFKKMIFSAPKLDDKASKEALDNSIVASTKLIKSPRIPRQALTMAIEEMEMILNDNELNDWFFKDLTRTHGIKIWSYFALHDHWVHDNTRAYILSRYHDESNHNLSFQIGEVDDGITHSFCVDQSVEFSQITLQMMDRFM